MVKEFNEIWEQIKRHDGEEFKTKTGIPFTIHFMDDESIDTGHHRILKKYNFESAYVIKDLHSPSQIQKIYPSMNGTSYIYAILTDQRIYGNCSAAI